VSTDLNAPAPGRAPVARRPSLALAARLALLTAAMAVALVLGATEIALSWSERSRLDDARRESRALATALGSYLTRISPRGSRDSLEMEFRRWAHQDLTGIEATVYMREGATLVPVIAVDSSLLDRSPSPLSYRALSSDTALDRYETGDDPAWHVATRLPLGSRHPFGVLNVAVSAAHQNELAKAERRRAYAIAMASAILLAIGVAWLTNYWVGRPLRALGDTMDEAHTGAADSPAAVELGPREFRTLAQRYNDLRGALTERERESKARAGLLALEEHSRGLDRLQVLAATAAEFAHEIGTPLNTVRGHLQLLHDDLGNAQPSVERVNLLLGQVDRMAGIVKDNLERITWPEPRVHDADLADIARRTLRFFEPSLATAAVSASFSGNGAGPLAAVTARCDPALVEQILLNLVKNAIEALPPGGRLTIAARTEGRSAVLEVSDNGPGLSPEARANLFNPFTTTKGPNGTGLGLSLSRRLAREMDGDLVHIASEHGTTWRLTLPASGESAT
jgi:signal transduction histidine kinase